VAPRTEINDLVSAEDWVQTLVAAAGEPDIASKFLQGYSAGGKTFKVHLDGYDQRDLFAGRGPGKRREFFYWTDGGNFAGLRYDQYKAVFMERKAHGLEVWMQQLVTLRAPKLFNLRADPFERSEQEAGDYDRWFIEHLFVLVPAQAIVGEHLATFQEFPPRQRSVSPSMKTSISAPDQPRNSPRTFQHATGETAMHRYCRIEAFLKRFKHIKISRRVILSSSQHVV
jgi:hypothetical protein